MRHLNATRTNRPGAIAPLTCLLLVFLLGMVAFAVDLSWKALSESELQNAADSAALAGAGKLGDNFVLYSLPNQSSSTKATLISGAVSTAKTTAKTFAALNSAGGVSNLALLDSDIDVGYTDSTGTYTSNATNANNYPNTVKVTMRRDSSANTPLGLFFAPALGISSANLIAPATATLYGGSIDSLKPGTTNTGMMPITFDVNAWNNFIKTGQDADGNSNKDSSGNPLIQIYPSVKDTGNFGWLSLNDTHVGASTLNSWISSGAAPSDVQNLISADLIPLSKHSSAWDWQGENGFKASDVSAVNAQVGKTFILPLFTPYDSSSSNYSAGNGQGSKYYYNIVQFVGITVMTSPDSNHQVWVQPAPITDAHMILNATTLTPLGASSSFTTGIAPAMLTK
jgi:Flp pilus assembly protein TadG